MTLTATDLFCGAGGSSTGLVDAGVELRIAANHWKLAVETHALNHRSADHDCADISQVDPRRYPSTDLLWASPECTNHSQAKSKKHNPNLFDPTGDPSQERSRATMWDVPRFAEAMVLRGHPYRAIIVENVVEAMKWLPFEGWLQAMDQLGYEHKIVCLNSMVCWPTPQSRDRLYIVFWRRGQKAPDLDIRPPAWCWKCEVTVHAVQSWKRPDRPWGKYRTQYLYRCPECNGVCAPIAYPALAAIDWSLPIQRIGDREKPLAAATRRRVEVGIDLFWRPTIVQTAGHTFERPGYARAWSADRPLPVLTTTLAHGLAIPSWLLPTTRGNDLSKLPSSTLSPAPTQTGQQEYAMAVPPAFYLKNYGRIDEAHYRAHGIDSPLGAITAEDSHALVELPAMLNLRGGGSRESARSSAEPLGAVTAGGNHHAVAVPPSFYVKNYGGMADAGSMAHPITDPLGSVTGVDSHSVVTLPFLSSYYGNGGHAEVDAPMPTQTTRDRHALVEPGESIDVDDCGLRMLGPDEVKLGMGMRAEYELLGTKRDRVRLAGNAVTPPSARELGGRIVASLDA